MCATDKITINLACNGAKNRSIFRIMHESTKRSEESWLFFHRTGINNLARWLTEVARDPRMKGEHKEIRRRENRTADRWIYYQISPCINSLMDWAEWVETRFSKESIHDIGCSSLRSSSFFTLFPLFFFFFSFFYFFFSRRSTLDEVSRGDFFPG